MMPERAYIVSYEKAREGFDFELARRRRVGIPARHAARKAAADRPRAGGPAQAPNDGKLRIIVFGAHPDDPEYRGAGVAMKWAKAGPSREAGRSHQWRYRPLAIGRRTAGAAPQKEVQEVARRLGVTNEVLDIHDGEILPTLENRRIITRLIRQWNADIVITNRPNDYHPDHRYTSILVQDSAYMVTVPFFCRMCRS